MDVKNEVKKKECSDTSSMEVSKEETELIDNKEQKNEELEEANNKDEKKNGDALKDDDNKNNHDDKKDDDNKIDEDDEENHDDKNDDDNENAHGNENICDNEINDDNMDDYDEDEDTDEAEVKILEALLIQNPYDYSSHVALIKKLGTIGELERLRAARENMSSKYPMSSDLWLAWMRDEIKLAVSAKEKADVVKLCGRAVKDYLCKLSFRCLYNNNNYYI